MERSPNDVFRLSIRSGMIKADDLLSGQPRTFKESGLLACHPIMTTAQGA